MNRRIILASTSRYRRELLTRLGLTFEAVTPDYEEEHALEVPPDELVLLLAERKAESLKARFPDALIIGADQVAELDGAILLKPGSPERAAAQLLALSGRTHRLLTGVAVVDAATGLAASALDVHRMTMRRLTEDQIRGYVERESPVDCAGAYRIEGAGIALFEAMTGTDFTGIIGLPLTKLVTLLTRFGMCLP